MSAPTEPRWPGEPLGLPADGPRSVARFGRRLGALVIDWAVAWVVSTLAFRTDAIATLVIFGIEQLVFLLFFSGSLGHLIFRMRLLPMAGGRMRFWQPLVRTVLLCFAVPALISDENQRGLHDRAARTILVRV